MFEKDKEKKEPEVTKPEDKPTETPAEKPEEKAEEKPAPEGEKKPEDNAEGAKEPPKADEPPKEDKPAEETSAPANDGKDEEILRLKTQIAAMQLGVKPDCMVDVVAIAESYVKNGTASDINTALSSVVKKYPDMKAEGGKSEGKKSGGGFKVGADSSEDKKTDTDKLSNAFGIKKKGCK